MSRVEEVVSVSIRHRDREETGVLPVITFWQLHSEQSLASEAKGVESHELSENSPWLAKEGEVKQDRKHERIHDQGTDNHNSVQKWLVSWSEEPLIQRSEKIMSAILNCSLQRIPAIAFLDIEGAHGEVSGTDHSDTDNEDS